MNNDPSVLDSIERGIDFQGIALRSFRLATEHLESNYYPEAVIAAQNAIEMPFKALHKYHGGGKLRSHNPADVVLAQHTDKLSSELKRDADKVSRISEYWEPRRLLARFGNEDKGIPVVDTVSKRMAMDAVRDAGIVDGWMQKALPFQDDHERWLVASWLTRAMEPTWRDRKPLERDAAMKAALHYCDDSIAPGEKERKLAAMIARAAAFVLFDSALRERLQDRSDYSSIAKAGVWWLMQMEWIPHKPSYDDWDKSPGDHGQGP